MGIISVSTVAQPITLAFCLESRRGGYDILEIDDFRLVGWLVGWLVG
jgi:hypothetical protein